VIDAAFAVPGDINLPTGGYEYARRVLAALPQAGVAARHIQLPGSFPSPSADDVATAERQLCQIPAGMPLMVDGLAYGALPASCIARVRAPIIALVHHPLCLEAGLSPPRQHELFNLERAALAFARRIVVTSRTTGNTLLTDFAIAPDKITVAEPGTDPAKRAAVSDGPLHLLAVGSVVPRKAHDLLVRALEPHKKADWRLTIIGATDRSPEALAALQTAVEQTGLRERIIIAGPQTRDQLAIAYARAGALVMASLYEGYGMVLAEAMARGLPIVCTTGGAAAQTVPDAAALKVAPGNIDALSAAIGCLLQDRPLRRRMADASWAAGQSLPRWEDTAQRIAKVIRELAP
jgi:glycosyltransferase involved in cell wall biosynthesis